MLVSFPTRPRFLFLVVASGSFSLLGAPSLLMEDGRARSRSADSLRSTRTSESTFAEKNLGMARDVVSVADSGVAWGFGIAKFATNAGFGIASKCIRSSAAAFEGTIGPGVLSSSLHGADNIVSFAHGATTTGQEVVQAITHASLGVTKAGLTVAGASDGELLRRAVGEEAADAVTSVNAIVRLFAGPLANVTLTNLWSASSAWGAMQHAALAVRDQSNQQVALPASSERWMRFTAATFGSAWFAGLVEGVSLAATARVREVASRGGGPGEKALAAAGIDCDFVDVLAFEEHTSDVFAPGYMVAVDRQEGAVVVALRGTASVKDILADLVCKTASIEIGGFEGLAHEGMWRAAQSLESTLAALTEQGLDQFGSGRKPRIVIAGHSLGAGVAALVAALWRDAGRFSGFDVECIAFACPQILDVNLATAMSNHTTSIVLGNDLVPRLSLTTAQDMRTALLHLSDPLAHGLTQAFSAQELLAAEAQGQTDRLVAAHDTIRLLARTNTERLYPSGRLIHIVPGRSGPFLVGHEAVDEMIIASDMASSHMPKRYLNALQELQELARASSL